MKTRLIFLILLIFAACSNAACAKDDDIQLFSYFKKLEFNPVFLNGESEPEAARFDELNSKYQLRIFALNLGSTPVEFAFSNVQVLPVEFINDDAEEPFVIISLKKPNDPVVGDYDVLPSKINRFHVKPNKPFLIFEGVVELKGNSSTYDSLRISYEPSFEYAEELSVFGQRIDSFSYRVSKIPEQWGSYFNRSGKNVGGVDPFEALEDTK